MRQQLFSRAMKEKGLQGFSRCANVCLSKQRRTQMSFDAFKTHSAKGGMFRLPNLSDHDWKALATVYEGEGLAYRVRHIVMFCPATSGAMHVMPSDLDAV